MTSRKPPVKSAACIPPAYLTPQEKARTNQTTRSMVTRQSPTERVPKIKPLTSGVEAKIDTGRWNI